MHYAHVLDMTYNKKMADIEEACDLLVEMVMARKCPVEKTIYDDELDPLRLLNMLLRNLPEEEEEQHAICKENKRPSVNNMAEICGKRKLSQIFKMREDITLKVMRDTREIYTEEGDHEHGRVFDSKFIPSSLKSFNDL